MSVVPSVEVVLAIQLYHAASNEADSRLENCSEIINVSIVSRLVETRIDPRWVNFSCMLPKFHTDLPE